MPGMKGHFLMDPEDDDEADYGDGYGDVEGGRGV